MEKEKECKETKICFGLGNLKREYEKIREKHNLPSWKEINEDFEIEKLQDKETDMLIRDIRRTMLEKSMSYVRFIEMFLNPGNAPMFFLALIKNIENDERKMLNDLYSELGKQEISSLSLDNDFNEEKEAEFIKKVFQDWKSIKQRFGRIISEIQNSWEKKETRKEKGYLG